VLGPFATRLLVTGLAILALAGCGEAKGDKFLPTSTTITRSLAAPNRPAPYHVRISIDGHLFSPQYTTLGNPGVFWVDFTNDSNTPHALVIEGQGGRVRIGPVKPGETASQKVDFTEPGEYKIYCPIDDHRKKGEEGLITRGS
jgi:plastocyanin